MSDLETLGAMLGELVSDYAELRRLADTLSSRDAREIAESILTLHDGMTMELEGTGFGPLDCLG